MSNSSSASANSSFDNDDQNGSLSLEQMRPYQKVLFEQAKHENVIVCLPTGTGKTLIAISLFHDRIHETIGEYPSTAKRTIFLAPTKVLVEQQHENFRKVLSPGISYTSIVRHGDCLGIDFFTREDWNEYFKANQILFMTPAIFLDIIKKSFITFKQINLIVIDECHHAIKKKSQISLHPYRTIMDFFTLQKAYETTKVLPMSASLVSATNSTRLIKQLKELEIIFHSRIVSADSRMYLKEAQTKITLCDDETSFNCELGNFTVLKDCSNYLRSRENPEQFQDYIDLFTKIDVILHKTMGPWFALEAIKITADSFKKSTNTNLQRLCPLLDQLMIDIRSTFTRNHLAEKDFCSGSLMHGKLTQLFTILSSMDENLSCVIFVNERVVANLLYRYIQFRSKNDPKFAFLKPGIFMGSRGAKSSFLRFDRNTENMKAKFEVGELNVIVATSVLEEGIDVPICNTVIRYDFPHTFQAYIQSRGRARDAESVYIIMVDDEVPMKQKLADFVKIETIIKGLWSDTDFIRRNVNSHLESVFDVQDTFVTEEGAVLLESAATSKLSNYLAKYGCSFSTNLVHKKTDSSEFICGLIYPFDCPYFGFTTGMPRSSKQSAQQSCAFNACKVLIKIGEIDQHLNIKKTETILRNHYEELNLKTKSMKTNDENDSFSKKTANYSQTIPEYCTKNREQAQTNGNCDLLSLYRYTIRFPPEEAARLGACDESKCLMFAILLSPGIPLNDSAFFIALNQMNLKFTIKLEGVFQLERSSARLQRYKWFTKHILNHVSTHEKCLKNISNVISSLDELFKVPLMPGFFLLPLRDDSSVDEQMINSVADWSIRMITREIIPEYRTLTLDSSMVGSFIHSPLLKFYVLGPSTRCAMDTFLERKGAQKSFKEYYRQNYQVDLEDDDPLLPPMQTVTYFRKNKFGISYKQARKDEPKEEHKNYFPLKLLCLYPMSKSEFAMFNALPFIAFRIEQYLIAYELLEKIAQQSNLADLLRYSNVNDIHTLLTTKRKTGGEVFNVSLAPSSKIFKTIDINQIRCAKLVKKSIAIDGLIEKFSSNKVEDDDTEIDLICHSHRISQEKLVSNSLWNCGIASCLIAEDNDWSNYPEAREKFSLNSFDFVKFPDPYHIVKALTVDKAGDIFNNEQLETVGDAFLKMTTCLYLFFKFPNYSEGRLAHFKEIMVSNENLFYLGLEKELPKRIFSKIVSVGENWFSSIYNSPEKIDPLKCLQQELKFKNISDCVEALIGAFFLFGSGQATIKFFDWIGLKCFNPQTALYENPVIVQQTKIDSALSLARENENFRRFFFELKECNLSRTVEEEYEQYSFEKVENILGYEFKNKYYLLQAFTHRSYQGSDKTLGRLMESYERLEFIGDAIIDFVVITRAYERNPNLTPGFLSLFRQAMVNNNFFASIVVKFNLHNYLRFSDQNMGEAISTYTHTIKQHFAWQSKMLHSPISSGKPNPGKITGLKYLSDIFESFVGAIYLDNGYDLEQVWKIVYRFIGTEFEYYLENYKKLSSA